MCPTPILRSGEMQQTDPQCDRHSLVALGCLLAAGAGLELTDALYGLPGHWLPMVLTWPLLPLWIVYLVAWNFRHRTDRRQGLWTWLNASSRS